jgi:hypothetical protein
MIIFLNSSSVSIVSDYGLDDRAIEVRSPAEVKDFSSNLCVQISSEARPASYPMVTKGHFPGVKSGRGVTLTTHPHLVPRTMSKSSLSLSLSLSWRKHGGQLFKIIFYNYFRRIFTQYLLLSELIITVLLLFFSLFRLYKSLVHDHSTAHVF